MSNTKDRRFRSMAMAAGMLASLLLSSCQPCAPIWGPSYPDMGSGCADGECGINGKKDTERTFKAVAHEIDELEKHIEKFGSIVPKHADVWGQARLMMYRQEVERELRSDMHAFPANTLQAAIATSDQAFLASAFGLQAALGAGATGVKPPDVTNMVSGNDIIARDKLLYTTAASPLANGKLVIEPTLLEDQKKRFLDHLTELRRMNEGDDNTDAPGYALHLVRIPISVLTGDCTQTGYGAECTITATPHLTDDLLPTTFRNLVINDIVDMLTLPLTSIVENGKVQELSKIWEAYKKAEEAERTNPTLGALSALSPLGLLSAIDPTIKNKMQADDTATKALRTAKDNLTSVPSEAMKPHQFLSAASLRPGRQRAMPPSQVLNVLYYKNIYEVAIALRRQVEKHLACKGRAYHLDVENALREELSAAYDLLAAGQYRGLWDFCNPDLVEAIRTRDVTRGRDMILQFRSILDATPRYEPSNPPDRKEVSPSAITLSLAWAIIVDSALLNARFLEDMRNTHMAKGCACAPEAWVPLYLPDPPQEVRHLFNDYVCCRWPLHIFAIDPETEDQNVGDSFRLRREMQLALSLAFTSGQIGASSFTRYTRRIEQDIDTISINRTMIGFSHGDNTFGWRFYPRVQTPPINGNLQAIFRDLLIGGQGPGYMLRRRRLENGIRECAALVIMPSFVPSVDLEVTGNWFRLDHPKCKELTLKQVMHLSATVQEIQNHGRLACDQGRYRPGDTALALRRLEQLSERLPLQHQLVDVPFENTDGGFELLSTGTTDLGPELIGWYGAPGINPNGDTTLFLVGDHFSVHQTRVIVGGQMLDSMCTVDCAKSTPPAPCNCKSTTTGASHSATSDQPTGTAAAEPTPLPPPSAAATPAMPPTCTVDPTLDENVQQAARFSFTRHKPPTATNITTVLPPPPIPMTITTTTTQPATTALPGTTGSTTTTTPSATTGSPGTTGSTMTAAGSPATPGSTMTTTPSGTTSSNTTTTPSGATGSNTTTTVATTGAPAATTNPVAASTPSVQIYQVELLSRQVMRVVIPKGVYSKDGMVDVHIATPYGVSPALQIPIVCDTTQAAPAYGYALDADNAKLQIGYKWGKAPQGQPRNADAIFDSKQGKIRITWNDALGSAIQKASVSFYFKVNGQEMLLATIKELSAANGAFEISGAAAEDFAKQLLGALNATNSFDPLQGKPLPAALDSSKIEITPISPPYPSIIQIILPATHDVQKKTIANSVHVDLILNPKN